MATQRAYSLLHDAPVTPRTAATRLVNAAAREAAGGFSYRFSLHGAGVQIELPSSQNLDALRSRLPPGVLPGPVEADVSYRIGADCTLFRDDQLQTRSHSSDDVLDALIADLHFQVACHARTALFVHAGVVALNGKAIILPGRSHSGKSTIVAALVNAGVSYYSDEYAVIDSRGHVHPYLKPIYLRDADGIARPKSVSSFGGHCGREPVPVGLIVHTRYEPAATWAPRQLTPAHALLAMVENTVRARDQPGLMLRVLAEVARSASAIAGERGDAGEVVRDLLQHHALTSGTQS